MTTDTRSICAACGIGSIADAKEVVKVRSNVRRWIEHRSTVWRCPLCNSLTSLERVDLGPFYAAYPFRQRKLDGFTRRVFSKLVAKLRRAGLEHSSSVLDYGCSEGLLIDYLKELGFENAFGYDAYVAEYSDTSVLGGQYDFVIAQDVIEHVEQPTPFFESLVSLVKPGGVLYVGTPCADRLDLGRLEDCIHSLHQPYHICILSEAALRNLCREHGLQVDELEHGHAADTPFPFVNWTFLRAYMRKIDGTLDAGFDPPHIAMVATSPELLIKGLFGFLTPTRTEMMAIVRKPAGAARRE